MNKKFSKKWMIFNYFSVSIWFKYSSTLCLYNSSSLSISPKLSISIFRISVAYWLLL